MLRKFKRAKRGEDRDHRAFSSKVLRGADSECSSLVFIFGVDQARQGA